jgi:predicted Fe-Mo cluster-binding NifX family protein
VKIAITSTGESLDSPVDGRFGRARYIHIVDAESGELLETIDNAENVEAVHGAGIQTAGLVVNRKVSVVLTGRVGPRASGVIRAASVQVVQGTSGTCREVLEQHRKALK